MRAHISSRRTRLRTYLAAGYALFIVYGSLSPFSGWKNQGLDFFEVLTAPLAQTYTGFDMMVNLLAYLPFGLLLVLTLHPRFSTLQSVIIATAAGTLLSGTMEYAQMYLPARVSSNLDLLNNSASTFIGALIGARIAPSAWLALNFARWRQSMFYTHGNRDFGLALIALWMFAQVNPSLPMLGSVFITQEAPPVFASPAEKTFDGLESLTVALNLLMPGVLLLTLLRQRRHVVGMLLSITCLVAAVKFAAAAILLKSWALLLWVNSEAMLGILAGVLLLVAAIWLPHAWRVGVAAAAALGYVVLGHVVVDSSAPAASLRLYQWHYVHLLNYNGLSQTAALAFPFLLLGYLWRVRSWHSLAV